MQASIFSNIQAHKEDHKSLYPHIEYHEYNACLNIPMSTLHIV